MNFLRRALQTKRHMILLCLLSLLWLQFSGAHLHAHDEHGMHVHGSQSLHHSDLDHDHDHEIFGADIDITPAAVAPAAWQSIDTGDVFVLAVVLLLFAAAITAAPRASPSRRQQRSSPFYTSPPLRAPPAQP